MKNLITKYDLKAMEYDPEVMAKPRALSINILESFFWDQTPQGREFWFGELVSLLAGRGFSEEAETALKEMQEQWEKEND